MPTTCTGPLWLQFIAQPLKRQVFQDKAGLSRPVLGALSVDRQDTGDVIACSGMTSVGGVAAADTWALFVAVRETTAGPRAAGALDRPV